jgi:hypothetical protein
MSDSQAISIKAVAFGLLVDIVGTISVAITGMIVLGVVWGAQGVKPQDVEAKAEQLSQDVSFLLIAAAIGTGFTILGGYVAGRVCRTGPVLHGALVGLVGILLGLVLFVAFPTEMQKGPEWYTVGSFLVPIPAGAFGGYLANLHRPKPRPAGREGWADDPYADDRDRFD